MKTARKIGQILLCPLPLIAMLLLQVIATSACMLFLAITVGPGQFQTVFFEHYTGFLALIQLVTLAVFALWYYVGYCLYQPIPRPWAVLNQRNTVLLLILGFGLYCLISVFMVAASYLAPSLMEAYEAMIEESGLADLTFLSTVATLILAPLSEELIFRGVTYRLARKAFGSFWAANVVQALFFGIAHMNWVQGAYAFVLGLLLGYVCRKFRSLYAGILLHLSFNFFGTWFAMLLGYVPFSEVITALILLAIGLPVTWLCLSRLETQSRTDS